jgi:hypothetical protein
MPATGAKSRKTGDETINLRGGRRQKSPIDRAADALQAKPVGFHARNLVPRIRSRVARSSVFRLVRRRVQALPGYAGQASGEQHPIAELAHDKSSLGEVNNEPQRTTAQRARETGAQTTTSRNLNAESSQATTGCAGGRCKTRDAVLRARTWSALGSGRLLCVGGWRRSARGSVRSYQEQHAGSCPREVLGRLAVPKDFRGEKNRAWTAARCRCCAPCRQRRLPASARSWSMRFRTGPNSSMKTEDSFLPPL